MYNQESIAAVNASYFLQSFVKPLYSTYCFSKIPQTIEYILGLDSSPLPFDCFEYSDQEYEAAVVFLIDGFGWSFYQMYKEQCPLLLKIEQEGIVSKITSQFPSTTAAHVTTLHSGCEVGRSGVYEWYYYEPKVDKIIAPLPYCIAGEKVAGSLERLVLSPLELLPRRTFYQKLQNKNIESFVVQHHTLAQSTYSMAMTRGAHLLSYTHFEDGLKSLVEAIQTRGPKKKYFFVYFPDIDAQGHRHGTCSLEVKNTITGCMEMLDKHFFAPIAKKRKKIATFITADHGMVDINPKTTYYLNKNLPEIVNLIQKSPRNEPKVPCGSCRDFFLHIESNKIGSALGLLNQALAGKALCLPTQDLISAGFFGRYAQQKKIMDKLGTIAVLPFEGESVWWYHKGRFEQNFFAAHGGLTRQELELALLFMGL